MTGKDVCKKIRELRKSMKLTQNQFAELVNLSDDSIGKIERGVTVPTIETLFKIAKGGGVSVAELLPQVKENRPKKLSDALSDLEKYLKTRSTEDVRLLHEIAIKIFEGKRAR